MIVISLTTIDSRLALLKNTIISILDQSITPDVIHIFYSEDPFMLDNGISEKTIENLNNDIQLVDFRKSTILFSKTPNIGPYRKLIPALKLYKDAHIITIDDDHEYEPKFVEKYMNSYKKYNCIVGSGGKMYDLKTFVKSDVTPYEKPTMNAIPEGFGGILYHTNMFDGSFINFDYSKLSENIFKNDDVFFRMYTFIKNIPVVFINIDKKHLIDNGIHLTLYETYNKNQNFSNTLKEAGLLFNSRIDNIEYENISLSGTDVKILQYEMFATNRCSDTINLTTLLNQTITNCIMINIEKDTLRYDSCIEEFTKVSIDTFVHLKATYWKEKTKFLSDMIYVLHFLHVDTKEMKMNAFSEFSDSNIHIQDGPLACYCSHMRAIIYGFLNFKDYTIIVEDDIFISNTKNIEKYIGMIPDDWDIICLNASGINEKYIEPFYKFTNMFHSSHFYIIRNRCMPVIFENVYPIVDQIDVLLSKMHDKLNIYNIEDTVYQKNFSTNTQNNLYVIFNSPLYKPIRNYIKEFEKLLLKYINDKIIDNNENNIIIRDSIMFDVVYSYIVNNFQTTQLEDCSAETSDLFNKLYIIITSCVKGINLRTVVNTLLRDIDYILDCFSLHDNSFKAYRYGSTSNTYKCNNLIKKVYNKKLRWTTAGHDDGPEIFKREVLILQKLQRIVHLLDFSFITTYLGESLYVNFYLPSNWKDQIKHIFKEFTSLNIQYQEFNIKNILVYENKISFIDFGLATEGCDNDENCIVFIKLLQLLNSNDKFKNGEKEIYSTFINNLKISGEYPNNIFI